VLLGVRDHLLSGRYNLGHQFPLLPSHSLRVPA
jgi:hypothetical protein